MKILLDLSPLRYQMTYLHHDPFRLLRGPQAVDFLTRCEQLVYPHHTLTLVRDPARDGASDTSAGFIGAADQATSAARLFESIWDPPVRSDSQIAASRLTPEARTRPWSIPPNLLVVNKL